MSSPRRLLLGLAGAKLALALGVSLGGHFAAEIAAAFAAASDANASAGDTIDGRGT